MVDVSGAYSTQPIDRRRCWGFNLLKQNQVAENWAPVADDLWDKHLEKKAKKRKLKLQVNNMTTIKAGKPAFF